MGRCREGRGRIGVEHLLRDEGLFEGYRRGGGGGGVITRRRTEEEEERRREEVAVFFAIILPVDRCRCCCCRHPSIRPSDRPFATRPTVRFFRHRARCFVDRHYHRHRHHVLIFVTFLAAHALKCCKPYPACLCNPWQPRLTDSLPAVFIPWPVLLLIPPSIHSPVHSPILPSHSPIQPVHPPIHPSCRIPSILPAIPWIQSRHPNIQHPFVPSSPLPAPFPPSTTTPAPRPLLTCANSISA